MSSSLLSEPSTVKLLARDRSPLTENWPAVPTPAPCPGPATLPSVCGGGATPGKSSASSSKLRVADATPRGRRETFCSVNDPLRRASTVLISERIAVSAALGGGGGGEATAL